jgi:hypothetical protein
MTNLIPSPSWLDAAIEFCVAKTRQNLATLASFPERTEAANGCRSLPKSMAGG